MRDALPPFPYALFALSLNAGLLAIPLLAELGLVLRRDEGGEWVEALPARPLELSLARTLAFLGLLLSLSLAVLGPASLLAPGALGLPQRLALPGLGCALALLLAVVLIWAQRLLLGRAEGLLVLLQTTLVASVVVGLLLVLGHLPELGALEPPTSGRSWLSFYPPSWFAVPLVHGGRTWLPALALGALSLAALALVRQPVARTVVRRPNVLETLLAPLRRAATFAWVRRDERGAFDLVYDALPREREVLLRTYPLLGIPIAFLWIGARGAQGRGDPWRDDLLALLFFTAGVYLPVLLSSVPLTESPRASWLLRTAPVPPGAIAAGAIKALFVRFLLPLHLALSVLALALSGPHLLARLALPALLVSLLVLRLLYGRCVRDLPLSVPPEDLRSELDWTGLGAGLAALLTLGALLANRLLDVRLGLSTALLLGIVDAFLARRLRSRLG